MGRLSSSIGLITGTEIVKTVDQLIAISAQPRNRLVARTEKLQEQQKALADLTALVIGVELSAKRLDVPAQFQARSATSSNSDALSVTADSKAAIGSFSGRVLQLASTHTAQSNFRSASPTAALGLTGEIAIRGGGMLAESASLTDLNQGRGVQAGSIRITDRSGKSADIDLSKATTIDDVIEAINQNGTVGIQATTVGDTIRLTDTTGSTAFNLRVDEVGNGETAADLGLRGINAASSTATGHDIFGDLGDPVAKGLQGVKLSELKGGAGLGALTSINVTTSNGNTGSINLSSAESTQDIIRLINDSGLGIEAKLNEGSGGFRIRDLTGGNANSLTISSSDTTATKLGIAGTASGRVIDGSDLGRPFVKASTPLSQLRQGKGITPGTITINDSQGDQAEIDLTDADKITIGTMINRINAAGLSVTASLNSTGDGFRIVDTGNGSGKLTITDAVNGKTAADLGLTGSATTTSLGPLVKLQTLSSAERQTIKIAADDSLDSIAKKFNTNSRLATASVVQADDGTYSLSIRSNRGGDGGRLAISSTGTGLGVSTTSVGQDAILSVSSEVSGTRLLRSADGVFSDVAPGVSVTAKAVTSEQVSLNISRDTTAATTNIKAFVEQYNKLTDKLKTLTFFDGNAATAGLLFGSSEALRIESTYTRLISGQISGAGSIRSFGELGVSFNAEGKMELNETRFTDRLRSNSDAVETFFTSSATGAVARVKEASDRLAGVNSSLLLNRSEALGLRILRSNDQAASLQKRLDTERTRLLKQFIGAEEAIAKLQTNQNAISNIQFIGSRSAVR